MATQESYIAALNTLSTVKGCAKSDYWSSLIAKALDKALVKGSVQATLSNPLAYFVVPLAGEGKKGRSHDFVKQQFAFTLMKVWEKDADKRLRGVDQEAIAAGLAVSWARKDSSLGSKDERREAAKQSSINMVALIESNQARLEAKRLEQSAKKAAAKAAKGTTPMVDDAGKQDTGEI